MNRKLVLAIVLGAFTLGACTFTDVEVSRTKTKKGDRVITQTRTDYDNDQNYKIEYFVDEPDTGGAYEVVACASAFCKTAQGGSAVPRGFGGTRQEK